jgi:hypothetical protein
MLVLLARLKSGPVAGTGLVATDKGRGGQVWTGSAIIIGGDAHQRWYNSTSVKSRSNKESRMP